MLTEDAVSLECEWERHVGGKAPDAPHREQPGHSSNSEASAVSEDEGKRRIPKPLTSELGRCTLVSNLFLYSCCS